MSKIRLNRRTLSLALAVVTIAFLQSFYPATRAHLRAPAATADLTTEIQTLNSFANDLSSLENKVIEFQRRSSITASELNSAKTSASTLKSKLSPTQQAFQSVIRKLKAAGEWEDFDNATLRRITDSDAQTLMRDNGGAKRNLEELASQLSTLSQEIDSLVQPLNSRVASTGFSIGRREALGFMPVRASVARTTTLFSTLKCRFRDAINTLKPSTESAKKMCCACNVNPPSSCGCASTATQ